MAQENTISVSLSSEEQEVINSAMSQIANVLKDKAVSLQPQDRQYYGRVKYEKEVWIDKVKNHMDNNPDKIPSYIDKAEFDKDYDAHKILNPMIANMEQQLNLMQDTNLLLGYDLDNCALMFYRAIKVAATNNDAGARTIHDDLKQQFPGKGGAKKPPVTP